MFSSSTSNLNPFANFSSSFHHFPPAFSGFEPNNVFINTTHELHDPRIAESLTANMAVLDSITMTNAEYYGPSNLINPSKKPAPPPPAARKKDRHSKICTAQGLRDRRVRLSIDIAREFFDLQDMLGFDKASKTLEWLLSKSRRAIKELAQMKCEVVSENGGGLDLEASTGAPKSKSSEDVSEEKDMEKLIHPAKDSRDKARARARERTREKMCTRKLHDRKKGLDTTTCSQILTHFAGNVAQANQARMGDVVSDQEESIMLKRKMNPSSIFTHQQNPQMSKDVSQNTNYIISNLPQNWDTATFPAITNMNLLTTGLESWSRPWETHSSTECDQH